MVRIRQEMMGREDESGELCSSPEGRRGERRLEASTQSNQSLRPWSLILPYLTSSSSCLSPRC